MTIPLPTDVTDLDVLGRALDQADSDARVTWCRTLNGKQLYHLYALAQGKRSVTVDQLVGDDGEVVIHMGKNGVPVFTRFQKRFARLGDEIVGYNDGRDGVGGPVGAIYRWLVGPGHYTAYDSPQVPGEVWIDYRTIPTRQHPEFPPLEDNDHGFPSLVFGNMVDILRRVSDHVFIGDATKTLTPPKTLGCKVGALFPTAPFALVQVRK